MEIIFIKKLNIIELKKRNLFDKYSNYLSLFFQILLKKFVIDIVVKLIKLIRKGVIYNISKLELLHSKFFQTLFQQYMTLCRYEPHFKEYSLLEK